MVKLVVIADDFTGALDTGIKFAKAGARSQVMLQSDFEPEEICEESEVLIVDAETRHLNRDAAYRIVYNLVRHCERCGVTYFYKKTDSALRGNVGSELSALSDATGCSVHFAPALPCLNRIIRNGILYVDNVPVAQSLFGKDPFEPVKKSLVEEVIREGTDMKVVSLSGCKRVKHEEDRSIYVYDAQNQSEMENIAKCLFEKAELKATAGCAGFADCLTRVIGFSKEGSSPIHRVKNLLVVCGSVNEITKKQVEYAEKRGFQRIRLNVLQKLQPNYFEREEAREFEKEFWSKYQDGFSVILDVFSGDNTLEEAEQYSAEAQIPKGEIRERIAQRLCEFADIWLHFGTKSALVLTGGDTVYTFLERKKCREIRPICEIVPGAVLFEAEIFGQKLQIISKSGGFGNESVFVELADAMLDGGANFEEGLS